MSSSAFETCFMLPDTLATWPYTRCINPNYHVVKAESTVWHESFHAFTAAKQETFNSCNFPLAVAMAYPYFDKKKLRICADILQFIFTFDEYSDVENEDGVRNQKDIVMDALRNPLAERPEGEGILGEMAREMWSRAVSVLPPHTRERFVDTMDPYLEAVIQEAEDRRLGHVRGIRDYLSVRRGTVGIIPLFALIEADLKKTHEEFDAMVDDKAVQELEKIAVDMCILGNDMVSYIMECNMGHFAQNVVTAAMNELHIDVHGALHWLEEEHDLLMKTFLKIRDGTAVSSLDQETKRYIWGLGNWVRSADSWWFESERFFGKRGALVQKQRRVDAGMELQISV